MTKCSFCGDSVKEGRGKIYVKNDGKIFQFCNSKCQKNWNLKRQGKSIRWTKIFRDMKAAEKEKGK